LNEVPEDTADLIDSEPVLFLNCTSSEIQVLAIVGVIIGFAIGSIVALLTGTVFLVLPFLLLFPMISIYKGGKQLGKAKEGKPNGYYDRLISTRMSRLGIRVPFLINNHIVTYTGYWRNRR
jgi:conjugative transfer region protein (TIGR03750 family)